MNTGSNGWDAETGERTLAEAGEAAAIAAFLPALPASTARLLGPGDDAAVLAAADGRFVVSTDTLVHGPDFRTAWSTPGDLGAKLAAVNLADVAAMGAQPMSLVISLVVPADIPVRALTEFSMGVAEACAHLAPGCGVEGGDLATGPVLVAAATAFGDLAGRAPVTRAGAGVGDIVAVSGALGSAARGLRRLFAEGCIDAVPDAGRARALRTDPEVVAQLRPSPPIADGVVAALAGATAMLDVSDGLLLDARRIAAASGVALDLDGARAGDEFALHGGEDHALLACFPAGTVLPGGFRPIGIVRTGDGVRIDGRVVTERGGWDPFVQWDGQRG